MALSWRTQKRKPSTITSSPAVHGGSEEGGVGTLVLVAVLVASVVVVVVSWMTETWGGEDRR